MAPSIASHLSMPRAIFPIESIAGARRKQNAGEGEVWRGLYRAEGGEHLDQVRMSWWEEDTGGPSPGRA